MNAVGQVGIDDFVDRFPLFETSVRELRCRFGRDARHLCFVAAGVGDYFVLGFRGKSRDTGVECAARDVDLLLIDFDPRLLAGLAITETQFGGTVAFGIGPNDAAPGIDLREAYLGVGNFDVKRPFLFEAVVGDINVADRFERSQLVDRRCHRGDVCRTEFQPRDLEVAQIGPFRNVCFRRKLIDVDFRSADLRFDFEITFDLLVRYDRPFVILIKRKGDVERSPQVECPRKGFRRPGIFGDRYFVDLYVGDVGLFVQMKCDDSFLGIDIFGCAGETFAFDTEDLQRDDRIRNRIFDAGGQQQEYADKYMSEMFHHALLAFLFHR